MRNIKHWLAALVVLAGLSPAVSAGDPAYGEPEPPNPPGLRPYSQRSFRFYYLHRAYEKCCVRPNVESYPVFPSDVAPSYKIVTFPCPFVYPSQFYTTPQARY